MQIKDLFAKTAVFELKTTEGESTGVTFKLRPNEDSTLKTRIRQEVQALPARPADGAPDSAYFEYMVEVDASERRILAARVISVDGLDEFDGTTESIAALIMQLPPETISQINEFIADRKNFFKG